MFTSEGAFSDDVVANSPDPELEVVAFVVDGTFVAATGPSSIAGADFSPLLLKSEGLAALKVVIPPFKVLLDRPPEGECSPVSMDALDDAPATATAIPFVDFVSTSVSDCSLSFSDGVFRALRAMSSLSIRLSKSYAFVSAARRFAGGTSFLEASFSSVSRTNSILAAGSFVFGFVFRSSQCGPTSKLTVCLSSDSQSRFLFERIRESGSRSSSIRFPFLVCCDVSLAMATFTSECPSDTVQ
jgi:hypothetical protein